LYGQVGRVDDDREGNAREGPGFAVARGGPAIDEDVGREVFEFSGRIDGAGFDVVEGLLEGASCILVGSSVRRTFGPMLGERIKYRLRSNVFFEVGLKREGLTQY
jgi:hypothetical protein